MNTLQQWQAFLESRGAEFSSTGNRLSLNHFTPLDSADTPARHCRMTALSQTALLQITGPDSEKFLQGQLTCDVSRVDTTSSSLGAACTPQGRVYSSFRMFKATDSPEPAYLLRLSSDNLEHTRDTLGKYAVFFKTQLEDTRERYVGLGLWGADASDCLKGLFEQVPDTINGVTFASNGWLLRVPGTSPRFECWLPLAEAEQHWTRLEQNARPTATHAWILEDIRSGLAEVTDATAEAFIPHMLNFQKVDAISFDKGCYTGQEIVARTEYRGKAKRGLFRLRIDTSQPLAIGSELASDSHSGVINLIASAPTATEGPQEALVVMASGLEQGATLELSAAGQRFSAQLLPLDYA